MDQGGAIPSNLISVANTRSRDSYQDYCRQYGFRPHPARFPREVPEFFVKFLSEAGDLVLDPFGGSNMTGAIAEEFGRRWIAVDLSFEFLRGSVGRFDESKVTIWDQCGDAGSGNRPPCS